MANILKQYPEIEEYLDDTDEYVNTATEFKHGKDRFLLVTQTGIDGQQLLFRWTGEHFEFWNNETIIDLSDEIAGAPRVLEFDMPVAQCGPSSSTDHQTVHEYVAAQVNKFSSKAGPEHGKLACVWTVRTLVFNALNRWITKVDGTAAFEPELRRCFGQSADPSALPPGAIIISPTRNIPGSKIRNIGHVGFLGEGKGDGRVIYSNSSRRARLEQNFTFGSWIDRYRKAKGLSVFCYPLPLRSVPLIS